MIHPGHAIYKCPKCHVVVRQCRCPAPNKAVFYEVCSKCKAAEKSEAPK